LILSLRISVEDTGNNLKRDHHDTQFLRKIQRNDTLEWQQRILAITSTERKTRGINKSTLWYQKKKLADGKKIRLYHKVLTKLA
jgi:hypothetical protein